MQLYGAGCRLNNFRNGAELRTADLEKIAEPRTVVFALGYREIRNSAHYSQTMVWFNFIHSTFILDHHHNNEYTLHSNTITTHRVR